MALEDWYSTLGSIGGLSAREMMDAKAEAAGLPPIDSIDQSAAILGTRVGGSSGGGGGSGSGGSGGGSNTLFGEPPTVSPRVELPIGSCANDRSDPFCQGANPGGTVVQGLLAVINGSLYKLLIGAVPLNCLTGPHYPNSSSVAMLAARPRSAVGSSEDEKEDEEELVVEDDEEECAADADERAEALRCPWLDCGASGCLYNLTADEGETDDLARASSPHPPPPRIAALLARMQARLSWHNASVFSPDRGAEDLASACDAALHRHGGFWGPFV